MKKFTIICVILLNVIGYAVTENQCIFQDNCERCLSTSLECAWCTDKAFELRHRCLRREQLIEYGCSADNIYENEPKSHPLKDLPVKDYESANDLAVQVQPQKVYLKLVKGQPQQVKLTYRPARNNPLDLYILMDLTWTMRDDKETLVKLGSELTHTLRNLTVNYRLGFGSFADKPVMPMMQEPSRENPCANEGFVCVPTYGFKHHLGLTDDVAKFVRSVNASRITANLDNLEGGLDALMQVLVCPQQIGWRDEARKIVILVTDGFMHFAGDGLLAGITRPNDKKCHLNEQGDYLGSLEYDYPSLEEIYRELVKRKVNVIFAVTSQVVNTYQQMSTLMQEISNVDILSADSSNILELIKKSYESFIKRTQFSDNSPKFIETLYETDCGGQFEFPRRRSYCNDIALGTTVDFYVNFTLTDYPKDGVYTHKIRVEESSLSEYLEVEVEIQKPCPCDEPQEPTNEYGRIQCSDHGYLQCGMCQCDEQWTGTFCSCPTDSTNRTTNEALENMCRPPVVGEAEGPGEICSKRGECECGECFCLPGYTGTYCECEDCDSDCDLERADCLCGTCVCKAGWSGPKCECSDSKESCQGPNGDICSLRGRCQCDECVCDEPYLGRFCEIGSDTENKLCSFFEPCVSCLIKQKLDLGVCENVTELCSSPNGGERFQYGFVTEDLDTKVRCIVRIENQHGIRCDHYFSYSSLKSTENYLVIQANPCEPLNYVALFGFATAMTILLGLLIIFCIWFYLRSKDRREFAKFNEDQRLSVLNESPLYKDPITRYTVPEQVNRRKASNPFR